MEFDELGKIMPMPLQMHGMKYNLAIYAEQAGAKVMVNAPTKKMSIRVLATKRLKN